MNENQKDQFANVFIKFLVIVVLFLLACHLAYLEAQSYAY